MKAYTVCEIKIKTVNKFTNEIDKLSLNCVSMLRLPQNKMCIKKNENCFELYRTITKQF